MSALALLAAFSGRSAVAATGDNLASFDAVVTAGIPTCGVGTGVAYDGVNLILSCWGSNVLQRVNAATHLNSGAVTISGTSDLRALAWDGLRNRLWACQGDSFVVLINVGTGSVDLSVPGFPVVGCTDGLAYDGSDDTLWASPDANPFDYHYTTTGLLLGSFSNSGLIGSCGNSGIAVGGPNLYLANNGCSQIYTVNKAFTTSTLFATFPARLEDLECDGSTFSPKGAIWSIDAYDRTLNAWEIQSGLCTFGGIASCGNGTVDPGEQCDDGNLLNGDGCDANCRLEGAVCGNGVLEAGEQCDDGNTNNGDGCNANCRLEVGGCVPPTCNDNNPCTVDTCDSSGGSFVCVHTLNPGPGCNACNPPDCNDHDPCTDDSCDSSGGSFVCVHMENHGPGCAECGNGIVEAGETCDPPNPAPDPACPPGTSCRPICRPDCTRCGDGITQAGETCDDGNLNEGCVHDGHPHNNSSVDGCRNNCTLHMCNDPSRITNQSTVDAFYVHGRLLDFDATVAADRPFTIALTAGSEVVFSASLAPGSLPAMSSQYAYRNSAARLTGGIAYVRIKNVSHRSSYRATIKAYGDLSRSSDHMTTDLIFGDQEWTVTGTWVRTKSGWRLVE